MNAHFPTFLDQPATEVAPRLLGCELVRNIEGQTIRVRIVETEAYDQSDAASHSFNGRTLRTDVMFGPSGHLYVYFTYGMHYCGNIVTGKEGEGSGVLIRAVEPLEGEDAMESLRGQGGINLSNGPAKTCQALGISKEFNGHDLRQSPLQLNANPPLTADQITQTIRIGISKAIDEPRRFYIKGNPYVSKPNIT